MGEPTDYGTSIPTLPECPEDGCDSYGFDTTMIYVETESMAMDEPGHVADAKSQVLLDSACSEMVCHECGAIIIEEGEIVHDAVNGGEN